MKDSALPALYFAVKVLPANKVADAIRKQRFIQEARAASALNHPNIVTIYDIPEEEGVIFRQTFAEVPPRVEYSLTTKGRDLCNVIESMRSYGKRWLCNE